MDKKVNLNEVLDIIQEEAAEVIHIVSKIKRFGWTAYHPDMPDFSNRERLQNELGDFLALIGILVRNKIIDEVAIEEAARKKLEKLKKWSKVYK